MGKISLDKQEEYIAKCLIGVDYCVDQNFHFTKTDILKDKTITNKLRSWKHYKYVGKGLISLSDNVIKGYQRFLDNPEGTYFWISGDGQRYSSHWCRGTAC